MKFTVDEAIAHAKNSKLEKWMHKFLNAKGENVHLSRVMKNKGHFKGPVEISLRKMKRICGPEKRMKYHESEEKWKSIVARMLSDIKKCWNAPPLIAWHIDGGLSVADGNHRLEALKKAGHKKYWVIIWFKHKKDFKQYSGV